MIGSIRIRRVSMTRCINIVAAAAVLMLLIGACTITPDTYTIATVDDHRITLKDLQDDPGFRQMVDNTITKLLVFNAAAAKGITSPRNRLTKKSKR